MNKWIASSGFQIGEFLGTSVHKFGLEFPSRGDCFVAWLLAMTFPEPVIASEAKQSRGVPNTRWRMLRRCTPNNDTD